jgi:hypothetical protein
MIGTLTSFEENSLKFNHAKLLFLVKISLQTKPDKLIKHFY